MWRLVVLNQIFPEKGFNLIELLVILIIIGITAGLGTPSLVNSRRQDITNQVFNSVKGALIEVQVNANRLSQDCTVVVGADGVSAAPSACLLQSINYDSSIVSVTSTSGGSITYTFQGTTSDAQTFWVARKNFDGTTLNDTAKCVVVSTVGMIRTGIVANSANPLTATNCRNPENDLYRP